MAFYRSQILEKLRAKVAAGQPLIMGGAGIGLVAKIMDRSGIDVIMSYNTGPFRMDGHGSLAGYLAYGDANQITIDLARRIVPMAPNTPVIGGRRHRRGRPVPQHRRPPHHLSGDRLFGHHQRSDRRHL